MKGNGSFVEKGSHVILFGREYNKFGNSTWWSQGRNFLGGKFDFSKTHISGAFGAVTLSGTAILTAPLTQVSNYGGSATSKAEI
jgi:hypothetical protein